MVILKIDEQMLQFPSEFIELSVGQLDKIASIFNSKDSEMDQWIQVVHFLTDVSIDEIEDWPYDEFLNMVMRMFTELPNVKRNNKFEYDDIVYTESGKSSLTVRQTAALEQVFTENSTNQFSQILGIVFIDPRLSKTDNLKLENIKKKAEIIAQLPLKQFLPQILTYGLEFVTNLKSSLINESTSVTGNTPA